MSTLLISPFPPGGDEAAIPVVAWPRRHPGASDGCVVTAMTDAGNRWTFRGGRPVMAPATESSLLPGGQQARPSVFADRTRGAIREATSSIAPLEMDRKPFRCGTRCHREATEGRAHSADGHGGASSRWPRAMYRSSTLARRDGFAIIRREVLPMGRQQLKSDRAVEETLETLAASRAALQEDQHTVAELEAALSDGEVTLEEAYRFLASARRSLAASAQTVKEAQEAVRATEEAYYADRAADTIRRVGVESASHQRLHVLAMAGVAPIDAPNNVIEFPTANTNDAA